MATTPREDLAREKKTIETLAADGTITDEYRDALLEWADALDDKTVRHKYRDDDGNVTTFSLGTIETYLADIRRYCAERDLDLTTSTADEFNDWMDTIHDAEGSPGAVTLSKCQSAVKTFYRYHDLGVDPADIHVYNAKSEPRHDETDLFTEEEVDALRRACGASGSSVRNRAFLELLIFTSQRIGALLTLRIKDVDLNPSNGGSASIYLNADYDKEYGGLKGARCRGRRRPIFGARKYVRDWLLYHPEGDDPNAWLFIGDPSHWKTDPDDHWAESSAQQALQRIAEQAGVTKPVDPTNFRNYCATVLNRDCNLDNDTIRMLMGHSETSTTLEQTYQHLVNDDYIRKAEEKTGYRDAEEPKSFTPDTCPTCGELLDSHWRQCPSCQEVFGPSDDFEEQLAARRDEAADVGLAAYADGDEFGARVAAAFREAGADPEAWLDAFYAAGNP
ncbi:tyrosine-type recombinase/integrase [Halorarum salinum]|uniref:Tyrosine-type recombinase/integrase n=1 Tax=Halorarum salinum TaxID=2743089 RepID=A0A7D5QBY6_9EURY|nr:tyrosine-type recombinase/integrase [Halobaculum salinum]QLG62639.1 tyrosine-type recombinase/integrase [Halobaculum salinum]